MFPELFMHSKRKNRTVADALSDNKWIRDIDHNMSQQIIVQYLQLWDELRPIALVESEQDRIIWTNSSSGEYSAKSAYDLHFQSLGICYEAKLIWKTKAPPKCRFFIWLLLQDRIWTAARLQVRQWPNEYFCQLCVRNLETAHHLFDECSVARNIWHRIGQWARTMELEPVSWTITANVREWFILRMNQLPSSAKNGLRSLIVLTIWEIWRERNSGIFMKKGKQVQGIVEAIQDKANTWAQVGNKGLLLLLRQLATYREP
jgi:hypothetical protein